MSQCYCEDCQKIEYCHSSQIEALKLENARLREAERWRNAHKNGLDDCKADLAAAQAQVARMREALEWMIDNQHLTIMIEEPEHVEHFMSRARAALEGKE